MNFYCPQCKQKTVAKIPVLKSSRRPSWKCSNPPSVCVSYLKGNKWYSWGAWEEEVPLELQEYSQEKIKSQLAEEFARSLYGGGYLDKNKEERNIHYKNWIQEKREVFPSVDKVIRTDLVDLIKEKFDDLGNESLRNPDITNAEKSFQRIDSSPPKPRNHRKRRRTKKKFTSDLGSYAEEKKNKKLLVKLAGKRKKDTPQEKIEDSKKPKKKIAEMVKVDADKRERDAKLLNKKIEEEALKYKGWDKELYKRRAWREIAGKSLDERLSILDKGLSVYAQTRTCTCTSRAGKDKVAFLSKTDAKHAAMGMDQKQYRCPYHPHQWHNATKR